MKSGSSVKLSTFGITALLLLAGCKSASLYQSSVATSGPTAKSIYVNMQRAANWQMDSIKHKGWRHPMGDWTSAALYTGLLAWQEVSKDTATLNFLTGVADSLHWKLKEGSDRYHADNYCVGQLYCQLYNLKKDQNRIADLKALADTLKNRPHTESLAWKNNIGLREWAWCDALFMGPPPIAMLASVTGDRNYMNLVDKLWWKTSDYLYDNKERLFFRDSRYFTKKEKNGEKVFWSRGNAWVLAGLARVLEYMPEDYWDRRYWVAQFRDMASRIAGLQQADGTWHASLLDPASYPGKETSGTGFYCYAMAWGINHGILDASQYTATVDRAWEALVGCLHPNGMLGFAQPIGAAPGYVNYEDTELYAVGAFLLAGKEMMTLHKDLTPKEGPATSKANKSAPKSGAGHKGRLAAHS